MFKGRTGKRSIELQRVPGDLSFPVVQDAYILLCAMLHTKWEQGCSRGKGKNARSQSINVYCVSRARVCVPRVRVARAANRIRVKFVHVTMTTTNYVRVI